uniref:Uncharacterized protein n=1 Tax=Acrobeloides nanus TaxID=290746 RepID=A0A914D9M7_9BILA
MGDPRNSEMYLEAYVHGQLHAKLAYSQEAVIGQWPRDETLHFRKIETSLREIFETLLYFLTDTIPTTTVSEAQENPNLRVRLPQERPSPTTRH